MGDHSSENHKRGAATIVAMIDVATKKSVITVSAYLDNKKISKKNATDVILSRRSAQAFDPYASIIPKEQLMQLLDATKVEEPKIDLVLYAHNVEGLRQGLYLYKRVEMPLQLREEFLMEQVEEDLFLLANGDFRQKVKNLSCMQDIAGDSALALSFVDDFEALNPITYKECLFEAGRIGQQLYIEATSLGLSATGIGCFFDDAAHNLLGLDIQKHQVVYNFTIGKALLDTRITTEEPYSHFRR